MYMMKEYSCGVVIFRRNALVLEFLVVQQFSGKHRFFPKWHMEVWETQEETACRETLEEVGLSVKILPWFTYSLTYTFHRPHDIDKMVTFFVAEVDMSHTYVLSSELLQASWLSYEQALRRLTYDNAKNLLTAAYKFITSLPW